MTFVSRLRKVAAVAIAATSLAACGASGSSSNDLTEPPISKDTSQSSAEVTDNEQSRSENGETGNDASGGTPSTSAPSVDPIDQVLSSGVLTGQIVATATDAERICLAGEIVSDDEIARSTIAGDQLTPDQEIVLASMMMGCGPGMITSLMARGNAALTPVFDEMSDDEFGCILTATENDPSLVRDAIRQTKMFVVYASIMYCAPDALSAVLQDLWSISEDQSSCLLIPPGFLPIVLATDLPSAGVSVSMWADIANLFDYCGIDGTPEPAPAEVSTLVAGCSSGDMDACDALYWLAEEGTAEWELGRTCAGAAEDEWDASVCEFKLTDVDVLTTKCSEGDMLFCDKLYWSSEADRGAKNFASTCGGASEDEMDGQCYRFLYLPNYRGDCMAGDMDDCNLLYWAAPAFSADSELGRTCGGTSDGSDAGDCGREQKIIDYRAACGDGDMEACDNLYWIADYGSEDETFAITCGGRIESEDGGMCWDLQE